MTRQTQTMVAPDMFTEGEWRHLRAMRARYQEDRDLFSAQERAGLRFLRWLYQQNRLAL